MTPLFTALLPILGQVLGRVLPDQGAADAAKLELLRLAQSGELAHLDADTKIALAQIATNQAEAGSGSLWASGWRPAVGWTCASGLAYQVLARPLLGWVAQNLWGWSEPASLEMETLLTVLFGMLGLGGYRTIEKIKGRA